YGHFWVARRVGIKVLKFSVGFGPALLSWKGKDGVQYVIAALPLGGYVKMAGEVPGEESDLAPGEEHRAYNRKPVPHRMAVASAGPLMNFLFAAVAFVIVYLIGVQGVVPRVGYVAEEAPAAEAGL
ncbi:MAG: site-2 protease family protein, partial [Thiohalorhabdaceae bacterium]